jgi:hypothetical protein
MSEGTKEGLIYLTPCVHERTDTACNPLCDAYVRGDGFIEVRVDGPAYRPIGGVLEDAVADSMYVRGWTCDMHEPQTACEKCDKLYRELAVELASRLVEIEDPK